LAPLDFKMFRKKVVFSVLSAKKQILPPLAPSWKNFGKKPSAPPGKNPSDAHATVVNRVRTETSFESQAQIRVQISSWLMEKTIITKN